MWYNITSFKYCDKRGNVDEKVIKEEELLEILNILGSINDMSKYQMKQEKISQEFKLKNIGKIKK